MSPILEVREVDQSFRAGFWMKRVEVLHGVSLTVPARSVFGFLGANGAGKTTLIHLITGLKRPFSGQVLVAGEEATSRGARARIGYLPERSYFHEHLTGQDLLLYFGTLSGMKKSRILERIPRVLSEVGMTAARKVELRRYSKGMLQRIGIAQAILHDPEFLVLDEPMSGLDPLGRKEMRELLVKLAADGRTIFFSTHVIPDVEAICDQVGLIRAGRLVGYGPIGQFLSQGPTQMEVALGGISLEKAQAISGFEAVRAIPDGVRGVVRGDEAVSQVLAKAISIEAKVLWANPLRPSLEEFFVRPEAG